MASGRERQKELRRRQKRRREVLRERAATLKAKAHTARKAVKPRAPKKEKVASPAS